MNWYELKEEVEELFDQETYFYLRRFLQEKSLEKAYAYVDNCINGVSEWDKPRLLEVLRESYLDLACT